MGSTHEMYSFAYYSLQAGRYVEAQNAFRMLLVLQPSMTIYWLGLLEASIKLNDEKTAFESLKMAKNLLRNQYNEEDSSLQECFQTLEIQFLEKFSKEMNQL